MKIRNGFISNSSSSSFVLITTKENYDRAMKEATPFQQALAKAMANEDTFMGKPVVKFGAMSVMDSSMFEYFDVDFDEPESKEEEDEEEPEEYCRSEAWDTFETLLYKNKKEVISMHLDG